MKPLAVVMALNGYELSYTQKELSDTILDLASGKNLQMALVFCPIFAVGKIIEQFLQLFKNNFKTSLSFLRHLSMILPTLYIVLMLRRVERATLRL